jgi:cobalt-zinc-cadmium efflux system outer membrane protein
MLKELVGADRGRRSSAILILASLTAGCAVSREAGHDRVASIVEQRIGRRTRWEKGPPDDARVAEWVRTTAAAGMTRERAVEIALVNSPDLTVMYEDLGISQADMVQAGLLKNPTLGAEIGLPVTPKGFSELRFSLLQDFLDLFVLPARKQIAREQFEADTLRVAHEALQVAAEAEKDFVAVQVASELLAFRRTVLETDRAAAELANKQFEAGNTSTLDQATQRAAYEQAKLDVAREELELLETRERLNRRLGLWGEASTWRLIESLPPLPASETPVEHLEATALRQRLDVASAQTQAELLKKAVRLARSTRLIGRLEIGVDAHKDPDGPRVVGPNLVIELPIFDQRQAMIARLEAQQRQQERRLVGLSVDARSEVRLADARMRAARQVVVHYRDTVLPLRKTVLEQSLLHYNGMFISPYQLLLAKEAEVDARRGAIEALRDYWIARADLARALGGSLPKPPSKPAPAVPATQPEGTQHHEP